MAHMQLEIEKQLKKKSPMAEMVNLCYYFTENFYLHILEFISKGYLKYNLEYLTVLAMVH
jgi:hypothetical protein